MRSSGVESELEVVRVGECKARRQWTELRTGSCCVTETVCHFSILARDPWIPRELQTVSKEHLVHREGKLNFNVNAQLLQLPELDSFGKK